MTEEITKAVEKDLEELDPVNIEFSADEIIDCIKVLNKLLIKLTEQAR